MGLRELLCGGRLTVFATEPDGQLAHLSQLSPPEQGWSSWEDVGPAVKSDPTVAVNGDGRLEVFAAGPDRRLGHAWQVDKPGGAWSGWEQIGPLITRGPTVRHNEDGRLEVFGAGADGRLGHLWHLEPDGSTGWSQWEQIGPEIKSKPAVFQNLAGHLELLAAGPDGRLGHVWQCGANAEEGWSAWAPLGPVITSDPAVFANADGHLEVLAAGPDGRLGHLWQLGPNAIDGWAEWQPFGPEIRGAPAVFQNPDGRLELFAVATDGQLGQVWQLDPNAINGWSEWTPIGPTVAGSPVIFQNVDGRLELFAIATDGRLGHLWQVSPNGLEGWSGWEPLTEASLATGLAICQAPDPGGSDPGEELQVTIGGPPSSDSARLTADVCVIGAGPAGITLSTRLVQAGARVVLLESGELDLDSAVQQLNQGASSGEIIKHDWRYLAEARRRMVGGATGQLDTIWSMPFREQDYRQRPWVPLSGWPFGPSEVAGYERLAAETFRFAPFEPPRVERGLLRLSYHFPPNSHVFRSTFVRLLSNELFTAELGATAVEFKLDGDRVRLVRFARLAGGDGEVFADSVILAAGGVENARLLLLNDQSLPDLSPMTGRCFMDHPHARAGSIALQDPERLRSCLEQGSSLDVLALDDDTLRDRQLLSASVQLQPEGPAADRRDALGCGLFVRAEPTPNPDSRVRLGQRRDRFGLRRPVLEWRLLERDWTDLVQSAVRIATALEDHHGAITFLSVGRREPWPLSPAGSTERHPTWGSHHIGTTRMADDPADGVVDRDCRVHGTANLYIAGSSVFPTAGCADPTFMIVTLAHRLADHLSSASPTWQSAAVQA